VASANFARAYWLSRHHEGYFCPEILASWYEADAAGRLYADGLMCFSWAYSPERPSAPVDWDRKDGALWIVDVVAHPVMKGTEVGKGLRRLVRELGLASRGDRVGFYRHRTDRWGFFVV